MMIKGEMKSILDPWYHKSSEDSKTHFEILEPWSLIRSSISESDVSFIRQRFFIPDDYQIIVPGPNGRIDKPPDKCLSFHLAALEAGLRFPLSRHVEEILSGLKVCPAQLMPNSFRYILGFIVLMPYFQVNPSFVHFINLISRRCASWDENGFFFLSPKPRRKLLCNLPTALGRWKNKFIYIKPPENRPWRVPVSWNVTRSEPYVLENPSWSHDFVINRLTLKYFDSSKILMEHVLALADLSPAPIQTTQSLESVVRASMVDKPVREQRVPLLACSQPVVQEPYTWKRAREEDLSVENTLLRKRVEELQMHRDRENVLFRKRVEELVMNRDRENVRSLKFNRDAGRQEFVKSDEYRSALNRAREEGVRDFVKSDEYRSALKRAREEGVRDFVKSNTYATLVSKRENMYKFYGFEKCRTLAAKLGAFRKEFDLRQLDPFKNGDLEEPVFEGEAGPDEFAYVL